MDWKQGSVKDENDRLYINPWPSWHFPSARELAKFFFSGKRPKVPSETLLSSMLPVETPTWKCARDTASFTWLGHSSCFLSLGSITVLMDPSFSRRCSPFSWIGPHRYRPSPCTVEDLPSVKICLVSHDHFDHMDYPSLSDIEKKFEPIFVFPRGLESWFSSFVRSNDRLVALDWWETKEVEEEGNSLYVQMMPSQHWGGRFPWRRFKSLWGGYSISLCKKEDRENPLFRVFFAGDTGFSQELFTEIGERCGPFDLSLIPIGAYLPRRVMKGQHVDPAEAVMIHSLVRSKLSVGIHWGTWILSHEEVDQPRRELADAMKENEDEFICVKHGETLSWPLCE